MNLSPEERQIGKQNFDEAVGTTRRDFLKGTVLASAAASTSLGAVYFGYGPTIDRRLRVGVIGTGDEGGVLLGAINPEYIDVRAIADIRPYSIHRAFHGDWYSDGAHAARPGLMQVYGWNTEGEARVHVKQFGPYQQLLDEADELDLEAVIIAVPLHLHHDVAIAAMQKGLHVLTEKLMAHNVAQGKQMARTAAETDLILATGHQRHYNILYDNAVDQLRRGLIGPIHHIRAQWHRANMPGNDSWKPPLPCEFMSADDYVAARRAARPEGKEPELRAQYKLLEELHSWENYLVDKAKPAERDKWAAKVAQKRAQLADIDVDAAANGYQSKTLSGGYQVSPLEELIRWRLFDRTGGGLMVELGSHQLDAASIFISSQRQDGRKVKPISVSGYGNRSLFPADRECDDHVHCMFEFPGQGYYESEEAEQVADPEKKIVVSYSSINGNGFGGWGETVYGTQGTLILEREQDAMLFKGSNTTTKIEVKETSKGPAMDTYETGGGAAVAQAAAPKNLSRGYREEIEHWAWCIRNRDPAHKPRCTPDVALADAVIALTSNLAIAENRRIEFQPEWFDILSDATPDGSVVKS